MIEVTEQTAAHFTRRPVRLSRRLGRWTLRSVPVIVWSAAIVAALLMHLRVGGAAHVTGYAEESIVSLSHLEPGTVRTVHVELYETVQPGQLLVSMDDHVEQAELATVQEDVKRLGAEVLAEQERLRAETAIASADADDLLRRAELDRDATHIDYLTQMMTFARDRILLRGLEVEYGIVRDLHDADNAAFRELNDLETQVNALKATQQENEGILKRRKEAFLEADRRCQVARDHATAPLDADSVLTPFRIAIQVRQHELTEIIARIDAHVLRAPRGGQVVALNVHPGDRVLAGHPLVLISAPYSQRVVAYLPEDMIHVADLGSDVTIERLAIGARRPLLHGKVVDLSTAVTEAPPRFRQLPNNPVWGRGVVITLTGNDDLLVPGEAVDIRFLN